MLNLKLKTIASLINPNDIVIDTCCDHAYLAIYLKKNKLCQEVYASDISANALSVAKKNIKDHNQDIKTYLSDGFKNINIKNLSLAVIAGVGATTALNIVKYAPKNIKFIISSNSDHAKLRKEMQSLGYFIEKEIVVKENNKFYPIILFTTTYQKQTKYTLKYGKSTNQDYFNYLLNKEQVILSKIPKKYLLTRIKHKLNIKHLKNTIKRNSVY